MLDRQTKNELEEELKQSLKSKYQVPMEFISAKSMENIELLRKLLKELISKQYLIRYPYRSKQW
ncbi:MAG: hypothetical protein IPI30_14170 [Saprospiraceae bacterium]|nr:hypothetical protein [Candidatus Vicinibacter affinis]